MNLVEQPPAVQPPAEQPRAEQPRAVQHPEQPPKLYSLPYFCNHGPVTVSKLVLEGSDLLIRRSGLLDVQLPVPTPAVAVPPVAVPSSTPAGPPAEDGGAAELPSAVAVPQQPPEEQPQQQQQQPDQEQQQQQQQQPDQEQQQQQVPQHRPWKSLPYWKAGLTFDLDKRPVEALDEDEAKEQLGLALHRLEEVADLYASLTRVHRSTELRLQEFFTQCQNLQQALELQGRHAGELSRFARHCLELLRHVEPVMRAQEGLLAQNQIRANEQLYDFSFCQSVLSMYQTRVQETDENEKPLRLLAQLLDRVLELAGVQHDYRESLNKDRNGLEQELAALEQIMVARLQQIQDQVGLQHEVASLQQELASAQQQVQDRESLQQEVASLQQELASARQQLQDHDSLQQELASVQQELVSLRQQVQDHDMLEKEVEDLEQEAQDQEGQLATLELELKEEREHALELAQGLAAQAARAVYLDQLADELEETVSKQKADMRAMEVAAVAAEHQVAQLTARLAEQQAAQRSAGAQLGVPPGSKQQGLPAAGKQKKKKPVEGKPSRKAMRAELEKSRMQVVRLEAALKAQRQAKGTESQRYLQQELKEVQQQVARLEGRDAQWEAYAADLAAQLEAAQAELARRSNIVV